MKLSNTKTTIIQKKESHKQLKVNYLWLLSRVDWIRTSDPLHPIQVRYRAAPPPELPAKQIGQKGLQI